MKRAADLVEALYGMPHNNQVNIHTEKKHANKHQLLSLDEIIFGVQTTGSIKGVSAGPQHPAAFRRDLGTHKHTRGNKLVLLSAHMLGSKGGEAQWKLNVRGGEENRKSTRAEEEEQKRLET